VAGGILPGSPPECPQPNIAVEPRAFGFKKSLAFSHGSRTINSERGSIMSRERITAVGESAALLLPKEVLDKLGVAIGDEVELFLIDRTLMLQPLDEADRAQQLAAITKSVFARRQHAYTQLAQGPE
jgi:antitoxin component of MazEF toxin-antitoxin module